AAGLRGHLLLSLARAQVAGQRRSVRLPARGSARARSAAPRVRERAEPGDRLCAAAARGLGARAAALDERALVLARRAHVFDSGRFGDGVPLAARLAALDARGRARGAVSARPDGAARSARPARAVLAARTDPARG